MGALSRRILHLRNHNASPTTPLATYFHHGTSTPLLPSDISSSLKQAATFLGPATLGFTANDISACSMRAAGAMDLYHSKVSPLTIRLLGRWNSDAMLDYLHVQAEPVMRDLASKRHNPPPKLTSCFPSTKKKTEKYSCLHIL